MEKPLKITFGTNYHDFTVVLNKRVNTYFKANQISRHANAEIVIKSVIMFSMYFVPYALIITGVAANGWSALGMVVLMGLGLAGIGLSVMHDANHMAYSNHRWVNVLIGYSLNLVGASSFNWKMQHNVLHHTYTNVHEMDEDIDSRGLFRMTPFDKWKPIHRYQYIYAWFFYGLMTLNWMFIKDFNRLLRYQQMGLLKKHHASATREWTILIVTKVVYIGYIFFVPLLLTSWTWWQVLIGVFSMHYITGFILAIIFQPAHVIEGTNYPTFDRDHQLADSRAVHQLKTTTNFANDNRLFTWMIGGLNFQIEHHLFPTICHVHYRKIAPIVRDTAQEFGLSYHRMESFKEALEGHLHMLKRLGATPTPLPA